MEKILKNKNIINRVVAFLLCGAASLFISTTFCIGSSNKWKDNYKSVNNSVQYDINSLKQKETEECQNQRTYQNVNDCDDFCVDHGPGREAGYSTSYVYACRNWEGFNFSYPNVGSIPYWINWETMDTIDNENNRNILINDIRYQASLWNLVQIHDGSNSGCFVHFFEVGENVYTKPFDYYGQEVLEIRHEGGSYFGFFTSNPFRICINYEYDTPGTRPGRSVDTPMHEFGHVLGLNDLDEDPITDGTHHVLMGYNRGTTEFTLFDAIKYSDIQGAAYLNGIHTQHSFYRYFYHNNSYKNVCFYCDTINSTSSPLSGSQPFVNSYYCDHDYEEMVSLGEKYWMKCTKCYKVIEHYHSFNYSYEIYNNISHVVYCSCGQSYTEHHVYNNSNHCCIYCDYVNLNHYYHSPYTWVDLQKHLATCDCGATNQQPHVVSGGTVPINYNGHNYLTCLLCGGNAEIGFINPFGIRDPDPNETYALPNGVIVVSSEDTDTYLTDREIM